MGLKIALCGGTGFIGEELQIYYKIKGAEIELITRKTLQNKAELDKITQGSSILINLAGEAIMGRWTKRKKQKIRKSRIDVTKMLVASLNRIHEVPELFIQASAIGIYKENSSEIFNENSRNYSDTFLGRVVKDWEDALTDLRRDNIRTVILRFGIVLGKRRGFLRYFIALFRMDIGTAFNRGEKYMSYIYVKEVLRIIDYIRMNKEIYGIVNITQDAFVTYEEFFLLLASTMGKPLIFNTPDFLIRMVFGEASTALLSGHRIYPKKLIESGYIYKYNSLKSILEEICINKE